MAPCIELLKAVATDAYHTDGPNSMKEALDIVSSAKGSLATYIGTLEQEPGSWHLFNVWESLADHQALIDDKDAYPKLKDSLFKGASAVEYLSHVTLSPNEPFDALNAPITEILIWTMKDGTDRAEFMKSIEALHAEVFTWDGVYKGGRGYIDEDETKIAVIVGWNSLEEFNTLVHGSAKLQELFVEMKKLADPDVKHVRLTRHTKPTA